MLNPAMEERKARLERAKLMLNDLTPISYQKALSVIEINTGASTRTAREYLNALINFGDFILKDGIITKRPDI